MLLRVLHHTPLLPPLFLQLTLPPVPPTSLLMTTHSPATSEADAETVDVQPLMLLPLRWPRRRLRPRANACGPTRAPQVRHLRRWRRRHRRRRRRAYPRDRAWKALRSARAARPQSYQTCRRACLCSC
jgi:hypothetical protein